MRYVVPVLRRVQCPATSLDHRASDDGFTLTSELFDRAAAEAGRPVKAPLYTSPDNPLGTVPSRQELEEVIAWAASHELHLVVDEIYALSVFGERVHELRGTPATTW